MRVCVLGGNGMLGSMVARYLARAGNIDVIATVRNVETMDRMRSELPTVSWHIWNSIDTPLPQADWFINCIGITKPRVAQEGDVQAIAVNVALPHLIADQVSLQNARMLQIATDCVFSGKDGQYNELSSHDAIDVYGKTKSLGEVCRKYVHHLRCSIIGREVTYQGYLLEWVRVQPNDASVFGYVNHTWNGITTLHFAKICYGIITNDPELPHTQHIVPQTYVTKAQLIEYIAGAFDRKDITVKRTNAAMTIKRTLDTVEPEVNEELWRLAGYDTPPCITDMITELAKYDHLSDS